MRIWFCKFDFVCYSLFGVCAFVFVVFVWFCVRVSLLYSDGFRWIARVVVSELYCFQQASRCVAWGLVFCIVPRGIVVLMCVVFVGFSVVLRCALRLRNAILMVFVCPACSF